MGRVAMAHSDTKIRETKTNAARLQNLYVQIAEWAAENRIDTFQGLTLSNGRASIN